jgi:nitrate/nitrite transport system permease protein
VSKVLRLGCCSTPHQLPAAVPMIFTGLRPSLGVAWMVLTPPRCCRRTPASVSSSGRFQRSRNRSVDHGRGDHDRPHRFLLDRVMLALQRVVSWDKNAVTR